MSAPDIVQCTEGSMTKNLRAVLVLVVAFTAVAVTLLLVYRATATPDSAASPGAAATSSAQVPVVRDNSHRLSEAPAGAPVFTEFLDFECEACGSAYPAIEQLREEYAGRVTFVARYFPIPSHFNAERAAVAVEAAAQQGAFEAMYQRMFETQTQWAEQQVPKDEVFRGFAEDLGLDLNAYDAAVKDPATLERVISDREDGVALGVEGTPTFFLDDRKVEAGSLDELRAMLDEALDS